jgi:hypothetical protein
MTPNARIKSWVTGLLARRSELERAMGQPVGELLGCGAWGCVFKSTDPWVVKLSIDPTEGPIWKKIQNLITEERYGEMGFVEVRSIRRLIPDVVYSGRRRKVWGIVRSEVEPLLGGSDLVDFEGNVLSDFTRAHLGLRPSQSYADLSRSAERGWAQLSAARPRRASEEELGMAMRGLGIYRGLATSWHSLGRPTYEQERIPTKIEHVLNHYFSGAVGGALGESLSMLASNGVYLRDVHLNNVGWHVARDDNDYTRLVIFDPGHTPTDSAEIEEHLVKNGREAL